MVKEILKKLASPTSTDEDKKRKEFILNILLLGTITLIVLAILIAIIDLISRHLNGLEYKGISFGILMFIFWIYLGLYFLSKKGHSKVAAYFFILIYLLTTTYLLYRWGIDLPQGLLFYVLIIIMSGVLISTRFGLIITVINSLIIIALGALQIYGITRPDLAWKREMLGTKDALMFTVTFLVIMIVSWLSNREIDKSLTRARKSEAELKQERDMLEIRVEERTRQLKKARMDKIAELYRFNEVGKLSSGLFHDLMNHLTALSLNLEQVKDRSGEETIKAKNYLKSSMDVAKKMENFIIAVKKQVQKQGTEKIFSFTDEIKQIIEILNYKALKNNIKIKFADADSNIESYGDPIKFSQIVLNLVSNAIDSYAKSDDTKTEDRDILIQLKEKSGTAYLHIQDWGCGIDEEVIPKIFEPFFSTKESGTGSGSGIGLSLVKSVLESDFGGKISVQSNLGRGTEFIIQIPLRKSLTAWK